MQINGDCLYKNMQGRQNAQMKRPLQELRYIDQIKGVKREVYQRKRNR